jgi:hypothetical protein
LLPVTLLRCAVVVPTLALGSFAVKSGIRTYGSHYEVLKLLCSPCWPNNENITPTAV